MPNLRATAREVFTQSLSKSTKAMRAIEGSTCLSNATVAATVSPLYVAISAWFTAETSLNTKIKELREKFCAQFSTTCQIFDLQPAIGFNVRELSFAYLDGVHPTIVTYDKIGKYASSLIEIWLKGGKACQLVGSSSCRSFFYT